MGGVAYGLAAGGVAIWRALARPARQLGVVTRLLSPFFCLGAVVALGLAAAAAARIGILRTGLCIGLVFTVVAAWTPELLAYLDGVPLARHRRIRLVSIGAFGGIVALFGVAETVAPMSVVTSYGNDIVYADTTDRGRYVVTSGQDAFELHVDQRLVISATDEHRYYESLVHPAMAAAGSVERVLLIGGGAGMAEREVLRHAGVQSVVSVVVDERLAELALGMGWLKRRSGGAMKHPKVRVIEREPMVWLEETAEPFDVIVVDAQDPDDYVGGKYYTQRFYELVAARLAPDGVAVVQAPRPFDSPRTFATIDRTLKAAGFETRPYHTGVPPSATGASCSPPCARSTFPRRRSTI